MKLIVLVLICSLHDNKTHTTTFQALVKHINGHQKTITQRKKYDRQKIHMYKKKCTHLTSLFAGPNYPYLPLRKEVHSGVVSRDFMQLQMNTNAAALSI